MPAVMMPTESELERGSGAIYPFLVDKTCSNF